MRSLALVAASILLAAPAVAPAAPTTTDLVEMAELSSLAVSPDGHWAVVREDRASVASNDHIQTWWVVDTNGIRPPVRVGGAGEATFSHAGTQETQKPQWSADSAWFYYRALVDGAVQVWRARRDGSRTEQVTHDLADVLEFQLDPVSLAVTYTTGEPRETIIAAEKAEYDRGILIDQTIDPSQGLFHGMRINGRMASQRLTGHWFERAGLLDRLPAHQRRITAEGILEELGPRPRPAGPQFARPGAESLAVSNGAGQVAYAVGYDQPPVYVRGAAGAAPTRCAAPACSLRRVHELTWSADGRTLIIHGGNTAREQVLVAWEPGAGRARTAFTYDGLLGANHGGFPDCDLALGRMICSVEGATEPGRLEAIDLRTRKTTVLLDPNREARSRVAMRTEPLHWSVGGYDYAARLFLPEGRAAGGPAPLFIQYYTCDGYLRGGTGDEYPFAALAAHGIAALCINYVSPKDETGKNPDAMLNYTLGVDGIRAVVDQLAARGIVDRRHVGMGGLSFGSEVTTRTLITSDLLAAASISSGQMEPIYYWFNRRSPDFLQTVRQQWGIGAPDETPERWKEVAESENAEHINAPLLMQLPEQETRLNYELFGRIQRRGVPVEMVAFPDEPHVKYQPRHKLAVYDRNLDWFEFWLAGVTDPDPAKKAQYERWRAMEADWKAARKKP